MLHVDIPTVAEFKALAAVRGETCVSLYDELKPRRATTDVSYAAHAATAGAVDQLVVDLDAVVPAIVSDVDGSVTYAAADDAEVYSVVDEIARRALLTDARVLGARRDVLPERARMSPSCAISSARRSASSRKDGSN